MMKKNIENNFICNTYIANIKYIKYKNNCYIYLWTIIWSLYRNSEGSNYWRTSNLRECNSEGNVNYTNKSPSSDYLGKYAYDKKQGF